MSTLLDFWSPWPMSGGPDSAAAATAAGTAVQTLVLADGRTLSYAVYGDSSSSAPTVFYFHGYPGSHAEAAPYHRPALARNLRIVSLDRPGMGHSTFQRARRLADWPADVLAVADHLSVQRFALIGMSGGAPYALACAHSDGISNERLRGVALVSGWYPLAIPSAQRATLWFARWCTPLVRCVLYWLFARAATRSDPAQLLALMNREIARTPRPDQVAYDANRDALLESMRGAFRQGAAGLAWDARLYGSRWHFGLEDVKMDSGRLVMWHGALDNACSLGMAQQAAALLQGAELRVSADDGHLSVAMHRAGEILDTLKDLLS